MTKTTAQAFGEADLARLETLLREAPDAARALSSDALQGFFTALAMGPDEAPSPHWLHAALDADADAELDASSELAVLLGRFHDDTRQRVREGTLALNLHPLRRGRADYRTWSRGFLTGVELSQSAWYEAADPDDLDELMLPIYALADELTEDERAQYTASAWRKLVLDSEAGLEDALRRLNDYWAIVRTPPVTVRHASPKAGRNDPCPCGSGRKFKHCCGR